MLLSQKRQLWTYPEQLESRKYSLFLDIRSHGGNAVALWRINPHYGSPHNEGTTRLLWYVVPSRFF